MTSSEDSDCDELPSTPPEIQEEARAVVENLLPPKSKEQYLKAYEDFMQWKNERKSKSLSESVFLAYFSKLAKKLKPPTLWVHYSMLKCTVLMKHDMNLKQYANLTSMLKKQSKGYKSEKSKVFTASNVKTFLFEAPDSVYLDLKRPQRDKILVAADVSESERLQVDAGLLFKHSNATPFQSKSIKGVDCLFCRETLPTMAALREHTHNKHENDKVPFANHRNKLYLKMDILGLQCKLCHTDFDLISTLQEHLTEQHNIQFRSLKNYILEFKLTDGETMNCARCESTFETFKTLQQHMGTHYKNYVCEVCAIAFINTVLLKAHMKIHERGPLKKCLKCDKVFDNAARLYVHTKMHRRTDIKCPHCVETFKNYSNRNSHILEEHKVPVAAYKCNVCDRTFTMKYGLNQHIKNIHLMQRDHTCPVCDKGFYNIQGLRRHMVAHGGDRDHRCAVCQKAFARRKTLREHMRIHNNDRRFQCGVCALRFVQKCSLKGHMMSSHGGVDL